MSDIQGLYLKAQFSPNNFMFHELCSLMEGVGFKFKKQKGSHKTYKHDSVYYKESILPVQDWHGKAKPYQVRQVLRLIDKYNLL